MKCSPNLLSVFLLSILITPGAASSQTDGGINILLAKARSLEARGLIDLASENWRKVLLVNSNQTEALAGLARSAKESGQLDQARTYLDRLRKIDPKDPEIADVEQLRVFKPEERNRLDQAGRLAMQHKPDEAMKVYREVLGDAQPPFGKWAQPFYETEAASTGGRTKAISQLRRLSDQFPKREAYRLWLASLLTYDPATRMEGFGILESLKDPGITEQARAPWHQALVWEKENLDALQAIEAYLQRYPDPDLQSSADALRARQQQQVTNANREQGFKALRGKDINTASAKFAEVLRQSPNDSNAVIGLAFVRLDQKRFSEALTLFERARTLAPQREDVREGYDNARFWLDIENASDALQRHESEPAILAFQEALIIRPTDDGALLGIAHALVQERKFNDAGVRFQQVLDRSPNNADALAGMGFVNLNEGRFEDATKYFAQARKLDPSRKDLEEGYSNATFWGVITRAAGALKENRTKDAIAGYEQALQIKPADKDALNGLANSFSRAEDYVGAAKTYYRLIATYPTEQSNWLGLIRAQIGEKAPEAAISTSQQIPQSVRQQLERGSEFFSEMALAYYQAGRNSDGDQFLRQGLAIANTSDDDNAFSARMQIAGEFMDHGNVDRAVEIYSSSKHLRPTDPDGWEGLVGAYTREDKFVEATETVRSMPQRAYDSALKHTGFLDSVAILYSNQGQCTEAEDLLQRSVALDEANGHLAAESTQLQLADIWIREGNYGNAQNLYRDIISKNSSSVDAWRGYVAALHHQHADHALTDEIAHIPPEARTQLESDPGFLILEASTYSSLGDNQTALPLLQKARSRYVTDHQLPPLNLEIQTAWVMLAVALDDPEFDSLILSTKRRADLTPKQRDAIQELWSIGNVRRAERVSEANPQLAFSILSNAAREYPSDRNLNAEMASLYLKRNERKKALDALQAWGMIGAQAGDFRVAAGTALSVHKYDLADEFLKRGLEKFPTDPELLHMNAKQNIYRGDYDEGERELKSALIALHNENRPAPRAQALKSPSSDDQGISMSADDLKPEFDQSSAFAAAVPPKPRPCEPASGQASEAKIRPMSLRFSLPHAQVSSSQQNAPGQSSVSERQTQNQTQEQQLESDMAAVENRNTPMISLGAMGTGRVGDPGVDRLVIEDTLLNATYTLSDQTRLGVDAHGVFAYSGQGDSSSELRFGTLPAYSTFGKQSEIGYAGNVQLSTNDFGLSVGVSPQGFPVHTVVGGLRFRPFHGWMTVQAVRDNVKDSLLSYAGAIDPGTGLRWGGVVSNTGSIRIESAPSSGVRYKKFGEYLAASYSFLQGLNVPDNWNVAGNAGLYWQAVPGLTLGVNAYAMHYDRNLSLFSYGQGGYFSPQQYYIASMPLSWYSRHPRFEYEVKFTGGLQQLHQDSSLFYPVLPSTAKITQGNYSANDSTAPNYDAEVRMGYRVAPHVYFDTFATANNARDYYTQSVGFNLRFMIDPIPTNTDLRVNSVPDWTGKQPFTVQ